MDNAENSWPETCKVQHWKANNKDVSMDLLE